MHGNKHMIEPLVWDMGGVWSGVFCLSNICIL